MTDDLIEPTYVDAFGERRTIAPDVLEAVRAAMGVGAGDAGAAGSRVAIVPPGTRLPEAGEVHLEDGTPLGRLHALPRDAPHGYHELTHDDGSATLLLSGPGRCHLPPDLRAWGWAVQLSATRSRTSWGIGDLGDLAELGRWSSAQGAGFLAVSPLGAPNPSPDPEPSPYYPSTRRFLSPLHLDVSAVLGMPTVDDLAAEATRLNEARGIDRAAVARLKLAALERAWTAGAGSDTAFTAWRTEQGQTLERWARFCVLGEQWGAGWQGWPANYRDPGDPAVEALAIRRSDRVAFHAWIQWCLDRQLAAASTSLRRIADMPVGVDPGGFDAWDWQGQLALDASIGAPPDRFNTAGQDWGLPPYIPHRLRAARFRPFIDTIRAQLRHAGGLRIDHVLGLFRLWWVPRGHGPDRGAYVRYPTDELLEIVAIESERAGAVVIGEDLGTVPPGVRSALRRRRVLSTRLVLFERVPPSRYPRHAFAAVTTHDLPTIAGIVSGSDLADQAAAGVEPSAASLDELRARLEAAAGVPPRAGARSLADSLHAKLAAAPPVLVAVTLEDAIGVEERVNLPGTMAAQRPNWSLALPVALEDLADEPAVRATVAAMGQRSPAAALTDGPVTGPAGGAVSPQGGG